MAYGPTIFVFGLMLCEECTKVIPQRHHVIIFFGLFFEWCATPPCLAAPSPTHYLPTPHPHLHLQLLLSLAPRRNYLKSTS